MMALRQMLGVACLAYHILLVTSVAVGESIIKDGGKLVYSTYFSSANSDRYILYREASVQ